MFLLPSFIDQSAISPIDFGVWMVSYCWWTNMSWLMSQHDLVHGTISRVFDGLDWLLRSIRVLVLGVYPAFPLIERWGFPTKEKIVVECFHFCVVVVPGRAKRCHVVSSQDARNGARPWYWIRFVAWVYSSYRPGCNVVRTQNICYQLSNQIDRLMNSFLFYFILSEHVMINF